jgi:putative two-component system response regulator
MTDGERILVLDDEPNVVLVAVRALQRAGYQVEGTSSVSSAIDLVSRQRVDLLLSDVHMPEMSGIEAASALRNHIPDLVVVMMTGAGTLDLAVQALQIGAQGFIVKPFTPAMLTSRVGEALDRHRLLKENLRLRLLTPMLEATVAALAAAIDMRDAVTGSHTSRLVRLFDALCTAAGIDQREADVDRNGAILHDIGKISVPDNILRKSGNLTPEEWAVMRTHPVVGAEMVARIAGLEKAATLVRHHHERWDGSGYPDGLAGEDIPLGARILAIADAYDAMTSARPYRPPMSHAAARAELRRWAAKRFDPRLVELFLDNVRVDEAMN